MPVAAIGIAGYLLTGVLAFLRRRGMLLGAVAGDSHLRCISPTLRPTCSAYGVSTA